MEITTNEQELFIAGALAGVVRDIRRFLETPSDDWRLIAQNLAASWEFPSSVVNTMVPPQNAKEGAKDRVSFNRAISSLSHQLLENLYNGKGDGDELNHTLEKISKTTGLNDSLVENYLSDSFRQSCTLATEYGLDKKLLKPQPRF